MSQANNSLAVPATTRGRSTSGNSIRTGSTRLAKRSNRIGTGGGSRRVKPPPPALSVGG